MGYGIADGFTGFFTQPIEGAMKEGGKGFMKGLGKGTVGFLTKPASGTFDHVILFHAHYKYHLPVSFWKSHPIPKQNRSLQTRHLRFRLLPRPRTLQIAQHIYAPRNTRQNPISTAGIRYASCDDTADIRGNGRENRRAV